MANLTTELGDTPEASLSRPRTQTTFNSLASPQTTATTTSTTSSPITTHSHVSSPPTEASIKEARAAVTATLSSVGTHIDTDLQSRASDIHNNSGALAAQERGLKKQTVLLSKTTEKWQKEMDSNMKKMKELGDVQNWAEVLERDLLVLEETMRLVEGREDVGNASGTNHPVVGKGV